MTKEISIYWDDLNQDAQIRLESIKPDNTDFPIAVVAIEDEDKNS